MKKIYNLNDEDLMKVDLKTDWDYRVEKTFGVEVPKIEFSFIKENILDSIMNDIEDMFQNTEGIISDDYILICESAVKENIVYINIILDTGIEKYSYSKPLIDFVDFKNTSSEFLKFFKSLIVNFTEKGIVISDFDKEFFKVWSFLPIHSPSIKNYSVDVNILNESGWDGTLNVSLYDGNIVTLRPVIKQVPNVENLESGYIETILDFVNKIKFGNITKLVIYYYNTVVSKTNDKIVIRDNTGFSCNRLWKELISNNLFRKYKNFEFISRSLSLKIEDDKFKYFKMCDLDKVLLFKDNKIEKWSLTNDMLNTILDCKNLNFYDMLNELNLDDVLNNVFISAHDVKDYKTLSIYPLQKKCDISIPYLTRLSKRVDKTYRIKNMHRIKDIEVSPYSISYKKDVSVNDLILEWTKLISKHLEVIKDIFLSVECKNGSICFKEGYLVIDYYDEKDFNKEFFEGFNADFIIIVKTKTFFYMVC